jgi:hypothetical protein
MLASCLEEEVEVTSHILIRTIVFVLTFCLDRRFHIQRVQLKTETSRTANLTTFPSNNTYTYRTLE